MNNTTENINRQIADYNTKANKIKKASLLIFVVTALFISRFNFDFVNGRSNSIQGVVGILLYVSAFVFSYIYFRYKAEKLNKSI